MVAGTCRRERRNNDHPQRVLVLTFILLGEYQGIGFLVAAKSILRFGTVTQASDYQRRISEYIIIGTLLSFIAVLPPGAVARWAWTSIPRAEQAQIARDLGELQRYTREISARLTTVQEAVGRLDARLEAPRPAGASAPASRPVSP